MIRRTLLGLMMAGIVVLGSPPPGQAATEQITVQTWGGELGDSFQKNVVQPFEAATGIKVVLSFGMSSDAAAKVRGQRLNPQIDVVMMGRADSAALWQEGLLAPLEASDISNLNNLITAAVSVDSATGKIYHVGMYGFALDFVYRTDRIKNPPTSYKDLLRPDLKGQVMYPSPRIFSAKGEVMMARAFGGGERNMDPGWDALKRLAPNLSAVYGTDQETFNLIASGEAAVGPALTYTILSLQKAGIPVGRISPAEGSAVSWDGVALVKGSPKSAAAKKFVNFMLSREVVEKHCNTLGTMPGAKGVVLDPKLTKAVASTPEEISRLLLLDDPYISKEKAAWIERWDREIVPLIGRR